MIKRTFFLVTRHTDAEIADFLSSQADKGWWLKQAKGNWFLFQKQAVEPCKICSVLVESPSFTVSAEELADEMSEELAKEGWIRFGMSAMENVIDSRRHLLLYATKKSPVFPVLDERSQQKAARRGLRTALGNALVCILYIGVLFLFLAGGKLHGFLDMVLTAVSLPLSLAGLGFAVGYLFRIPLAKKDSGRFLRTHAYRLLDHAVLATFLFLAGLALYLLFGAVGSFIGR